MIPCLVEEFVFNCFLELFYVFIDLSDFICSDV